MVQALGKFGRISQARSLPCQWKGNQARLASVRPEYFDVRFWHLADILCTQPYVRYWG